MPKCDLNKAENYFGKMRTKITLNKDTFHAVSCFRPHIMLLEIRD